MVIGIHLECDFKCNQEGAGITCHLECHPEGAGMTCHPEGFLLKKHVSPLSSLTDSSTRKLA